MIHKLGCHALVNPNLRMAQELSNAFWLEAGGAEGFPYPGQICEGQERWRAHPFGPPESHASRTGLEQGLAGSRDGQCVPILAGISQLAAPG